MFEKTWYNNSKQRKSHVIGILKWRKNAKDVVVLDSIQSILTFFGVLVEKLKNAFFEIWQT